MEGDKQQGMDLFQIGSLVAQICFYVIGGLAFIDAAWAIGNAPSVLQETAGLLLVLVAVLSIGVALVLSHIRRGAREIADAVARVAGTRCTECGSLVRPGSEFCTRCGKKL